MKKPINYSGARKTDDGLVLDLDRHVPYFFTILSMELSRGAARIYRQVAGIGITEWRIMCVIAAVPSIPAQQVCEITAIDKAAVSRGLKSLSELGFVKFTAARSDSRAKMVELSSKGRKIHDLVIEIALEREEMLLSVLNKEERRHLITALKKLRANLHDVNKWHPPAIS